MWFHGKRLERKNLIEHKLLQPLGYVQKMRFDVKIHVTSDEDGRMDSDGGRRTDGHCLTSLIFSMFFLAMDFDIAGHSNGPRERSTIMICSIRKLGVGKNTIQAVRENGMYTRCRNIHLINKCSFRGGAGRGLDCPSRPKPVRGNWPLWSPVVTRGLSPWRYPNSKF